MSTLIFLATILVAIIWFAFSGKQPMLFISYPESPFWRNYYPDAPVTEEQWAEVYE